MMVQLLLGDFTSEFEIHCLQTFLSIGVVYQWLTFIRSEFRIFFQPSRLS